MTEVAGDTCYNGDHFLLLRECKGYSLFFGDALLKVNPREISEALMDLIIEAEMLREKMETMIDDQGKDQGRRRELEAPGRCWGT